MAVTTFTWKRAVAEPRWFLWGALLLVSVAELLIALARPALGTLLHSLLLVAATVYAALGPDDGARNAALGLTLAPLIRILSLTLPLGRFPQIAWYALVSIPLLISAVQIIRHTQLTPQSIGLRTGNPLVQLLLIAGGFPLGALEYAILRPDPLIPTLSWPTFWLSAVILIIFTGFTEELLFRGVLQALAVPALGRWALVYVSALFAALHIGYLSVLDVVFVFAVGLIFAGVVRWSGSLLGVSLAHGLTNVMLFLVLPNVQPSAAGTVRTVLSALVWGGAGTAAVALAILLRATVRRPDRVLARALPMAGANNALVRPNVRTSHRVVPLSGHAEVSPNCAAATGERRTVRLVPFFMLGTVMLFQTFVAAILLHLGGPHSATWLGARGLQQLSLWGGVGLALLVPTVLLWRVKRRATRTQLQNGGGHITAVGEELAPTELRRNQAWAFLLAAVWVAGLVAGVTLYFATDRPLITSPALVGIWRSGAIQVYPAAVVETAGWLVVALVVGWLGLQIVRLLRRMFQRLVQRIRPR